MGLRGRTVDILRGMPALSAISLELAMRSPRSLPAFQAEVLRMRRSALGLALPRITPQALLDHHREYVLRMGGERREIHSLNGLLIAKVVVMLQPRRMFEIGTSLGKGTLMLISQAPDDAEIFTLDLGDSAVFGGAMTDRALVGLARRERGSALRGSPFASRVTQLLGDSMQFDFSPWKDSIDLVYVDGSHSLPYVESDTRSAMRMIRPGGVILWDDYGSVRSEYGTTRYLESLRSDGYPVYALGVETAGLGQGFTPTAAMRVDDRLIDRFRRERG